MPVYEYACITCDKSEEITRKFDDPEIIPPCSTCGYHMIRVFSPASVQFKGSGFYKTDNG